MESKAKILGHPIHPILIPFPLGLLSTSVVFDVVHLLAGNGKWSEVSFWMIAGGVIGGLAAAVFGLIDWLAIPSGTRAKAVGMWHGATNVVMVPAKQLKESVYQDPGVAVTGSSRTRTSGTTRDGALILKKDPQVDRGRDPRRTIPLTKAQGWVEAANFRDPEIDLQTLASVQRTHRGSTTDPRQWSR